jgi:hypothetical protein
MHEVLGVGGTSIFTQCSSVLGDDAGSVQNCACDLVKGRAGDNLW